MIDEGQITKTEAKKIILFDKGMAHTFLNSQDGLLVGADHSRKSLFEDIKKAYCCKKAGEHGLNMNHGLVIVPKETCYQSDLLFVETKPNFNKKELEEIKNEAESK